MLKIYVRQCVKPTRSIVNLFSIASCFTWLWNSVSHIRTERRLSVFRQWSAEGGIWDWDGGDNMRLENLHEEAAWFVPNKVYLVGQIEDEVIGGTFYNYRGERNAWNIMLGKVKENVELEDLSIDGRILLEWILKMWNRRTWTNLILLSATGVELLCIR